MHQQKGPHNVLLLVYLCTKNCVDAEQYFMKRCQHITKRIQCESACHVTILQIAARSGHYPSIVAILNDNHASRIRVPTFTTKSLMVCARRVLKLPYHFVGWTKLWYSPRNSSVVRFLAHSRYGSTEPQAAQQLWYHQAVQTTCPSHSAHVLLIGGAAWLISHANCICYPYHLMTIKGCRSRSLEGP
jgi:hypothetical protein